MNHTPSGLRLRNLLIILAGLFIILLQSCATNGYNNRNWRRTPASTGHNRCGCLIEKPFDLTPKPLVYEYQA